MRKEEILEILNDWNFWRKEQDIGKERKDYIEKYLSFLKSNVIVSIIGVRRSGKSTIMRQVAKNLIEKGIKKEDILMINFEDKRFIEFYPKLLDEVYEAYLEYIKITDKPYIFLDEVHNIPNWERWVRTMHELQKGKITVSGSSSKLLSGELATLLTGRHLDLYVFPFSFREFLNFRGIILKEQLDIIDKKHEIKSLFNEYMKFGGFPEVILSSNKKDLLLTYFEDILTKDIVKRYKVKKDEKLKALARFYLTNMANTITFNSLKKFLDITTNTIEKFSNYLEEANLIFLVKRFSYKVKEQEKAPRKVYSIDSGMSHAVGFRFSEDTGKSAENIVAVELRRLRSINKNIDFFYWQDISGKEVDFVLKEANSVKQLIQVCWDISEFKTKEREVKALLKASKELKCNNLLIITEDYEGEEKAEWFGIKGKIKFIPLWKWLLSNAK